MMFRERRSSSSRPGLGTRYGILLGLLLLLCSGADCIEGDAQAVFRREATESIGNGLIQIFTGVVNGAVAAIEEAGDDNTGSSTDSGGDSSDATSS